MAERFVGQDIDLVVSSDLSRAAETARALGLPLELDAAFRELDVGRWEGFTAQETAERFPEEVAALKAGERIKVGGGESWDELHDRVAGALAALRARIDPGARVVVVAHGGVISTLLADLLGLREKRPRPLGRIMNTAFTTLRLEGRIAELRVLNDASHVESGGRGPEEGDLPCGLLALDPDHPLPELPRLLGIARHFGRVHATQSHERVAAALATRLGLPFALADDEDFLSRDGVSLTVSHAHVIGRLATRTLHEAPPPTVRIGAPGHGSLTPIVRSRHGNVLYGYNVGG